MTALWLLPADKHDTQVMYKFTHMHHIHMSHTIHIKPAKQSYSHSTGLSDRVRNHRSHLNSVHVEFSDLTDLIDHRESNSDLCFTVNPDGGYQLVGVGCVTTSSTPIIRKHSHINPHV